MTGPGRGSRAAAAAGIAAATQAAADVPVPPDPFPPYPPIGHLAPNFDIREVRERIKAHKGRGRNWQVTKTSTVGIMVNYYHWTDLCEVPGGKVVHLSPNCPSVKKAQGTPSRLSASDFDLFHNTRICDHCISRGA